MSLVSASLSSRKYRTRIDVLASIVDNAKNGNLLNKIMEKTRLNYTQLMLCLEELDGLGLIEEKYVNGRKLYVTSSRGTDFLRQYYILKGFLERKQVR